LENPNLTGYEVIEDWESGRLGFKVEIFNLPLASRTRTLSSRSRRPVLGSSISLSPRLSHSQLKCSTSLSPLQSPDSPDSAAAGRRLPPPVVDLNTIRYVVDLLLAIVVCIRRKEVEAEDSVRDEGATEAIRVSQKMQNDLPIQIRLVAEE